MEDLELSLTNSLKVLFSALGAKNSNNNYAVPLINKSDASPAGFMDLSDLASVLGVQIKKIGLISLNYNSDFNNCTVSPNCVSFYLVPSGADNKPDPSWVDGFVIVFGWFNDNYFIQFAFGLVGVFYRAYSKSNGFGSWIKL